MASETVNKRLPYTKETKTVTTDADGIALLGIASEWYIPIGVRVNSNLKIVNFFKANNYWYAKVTATYGGAAVANTEIEFTIVYVNA